VTDAAAVRPIRRGEGTLLSRIQYARLVDVLDTLPAEEWAVPVDDCPGWDVHAVVSHVLGNLECVAKPAEFVRQARAGKKLAREVGFADPYEGLNAVQVREHAAMPPAELLARLRGIVERALRHRHRTPLLLRLGVRPRLDVAGRVPMGWILDVIYTRDTLVHRIDVCRATGRDVVVDDVEQRIVADMVREWAARHGEPATLRLTGPAGDTYECNGGGPVVECDAVEFARLVTGRGEATGLLATRVQV
jgi:uncharacterized protein (TIGR03083 family)